MLHSYNYSEKKFDHKGQVRRIKRGMAWSSPLLGVVVGEIVAFEQGGHARVSAIEEKSVELMILNRVDLNLGEGVVRTGQALHVTAGEDLLGHTIDAYGHSFFDDRINNPDASLESRAVEQVAPGVNERKAITQQFFTGVGAVDTLLPLGKGQRELLIGDRKTGKSFFVLQTALTQAKNGAIVIYCLIGKRDSEIKQVEAWIKEQKIEDKVVLVVAHASALPGEIFLTPYTAMTIAEYFAQLGRDAVVILDDLSKHAGSYREMSLLGGRFPGRDSYPGDIFHVHARLLERAGSFTTGGTITALPIVETIEGELTGYLQTNLMSMTDGHLYFDSELYNAGVRPAINLFISVTRVGRQTQGLLSRETGQMMVLTLKKYQDLQRFLRFGNELGSGVLETIRVAQGIEKLLRQVEVIDLEWRLLLARIAWLLNGVAIEQVIMRKSSEYQTILKRYDEKLSLSKWREICGA